MRKSLLIALAFLVLAGAGLYNAHVAMLRVENALALRCARASDGADMSIVECYTDRGLPPPEDML